MARKAREYSQLNTYTIVLRGATEVFLGYAKKQMFIDSLIKNKKDVSVYAYAITNKDAYMVVDTKGVKPSVFIKRVTVSYARKYNLSVGFGKVFYDRYLSQPLNSNPEILDAIKNVNLLVNTVGKALQQRDAVISSYSDYFSDAVIDTSFVVNNLKSDFTEYHTEQENKGVITLRKFDDEEISDYIYARYNIKATEVHNLTKEKLQDLLVDIMSVTKASARQIARITTLPLRLLWGVAKLVNGTSTKETKNDKA